MLEEEVKKFIKTLVDDFQSIYNNWLSSSGKSASYLSPKIKGRTAKQILEFDIMNVGRYLSSIDKMGIRIEFVFLAEIIAYLRAGQDEMSTEIEFNKLFKELGLDKKDALSITHEDFHEIPLSLLVAKENSAGKSDDSVKKLRGHFVKLAEYFIVQDGNLSNEELKFIKDYEKLLVG